MDRSDSDFIAGEFQTPPPSPTKKNQLQGSRSSPLKRRQDSREMKGLRPKVYVTEFSNFRNLVQQLTRLPSGNFAAEDEISPEARSADTEKASPREGNPNTDQSNDDQLNKEKELIRPPVKSAVIEVVPGKSIPIEVATALLPKWTVRVVSPEAIVGVMPPDDGYVWRKYGEKNIVGAKFSRSYHKCTHHHFQGCLAKKQVQILDQDPSTYEVTYRGMHTCVQATPVIDAKFSNDVMSRLFGKESSNSGPKIIYKIQFVRCPSCGEILIESQDIPVYKCGGCGKCLHATSSRRTYFSLRRGRQKEIPRSAIPFQISAEPIAKDEYWGKATSSRVEKMHAGSYPPILGQATDILFQTSLEPIMQSISSPHFEACFMEFKKNYEELKVLLPFSTDIKVQQKQQEQMAIMSFLAGLSHGFEAAKSQVLTDNNLASVEEAFTRLLRSDGSQTTSVPAVNSALISQTSETWQQRNKGANSNSGNVVCYYCHEPGHTKRTCPKLLKNKSRANVAAQDTTDVVTISAAEYAELSQYRALKTANSSIAAAADFGCTDHMTESKAKIRLVRCPRCRQILPEIEDIPVYKCGGCGAHLHAKIRKDNAERKASTCSSRTEDLSETTTSSLFEGTKTSSSGSSPRWLMQEEIPHHASPFQSVEPIVGQITKATHEYRREDASSWEKEMHAESYYYTLEQTTIIPFETSLERTVPSIASPHSEEYRPSVEGDTSDCEVYEWKSPAFNSTLLEEFSAETMTSKELGETSEAIDQQWSKDAEEVHTQSRLFFLLDSMGLTDLPKEVEWEKLTLISLMDNELSELPESLSCPNLQALFLQKNLKLRTIPASFFNFMTALQILNLSRTCIKTLPDSLFGLKKLKRLFLNHCELLSSLSSRVSELELLEVLDLEGTAIMALPMEVGQLKNLTSLEVSFCEPMNNRRLDQSHVVIPDGAICQLSQLQELNIDVSPEDERWKASVESVVFEVCRLTSLHTLEFYFPRAQLLALLSLVSHLSHFRFVVGDHTNRIISRLPLEVEFELEWHDKWLKYVNGDDVLEEVKTVLKYASAFFLDRHKTVKTLSEFGIRNMAQLKCCVIGECDELQAIIDADLKIVEAFGEGKASLEALEYLYIYYVKNLSCIWKGIVDNNSFIGLKYLTMHMCLELTIVFIPELLANLCSLEELMIDDCPKITKLVSSNDYEDQTSLVLPSLKKISLHFLPELLSISDVVTISPKMELMSFYDCPNLKNISTKKDFNKNLRKIKGELSWWHDLEWDSTDEKYCWDCIFTAVD